MTYNQIMATPGKMVDKVVYYYEGQTRIDIDEDNVESVKLWFSTGITGSVMKCMDLVLKEEIPAEYPVYVQITASFDDETAFNTYGPYYIKEATYSGDLYNYTHKCYDKLLLSMVEYTPIDITYPCTVQNFYNKLVQTLGYTSSVSLANGSKQITSDPYDIESYTYRDAIDDIAHANGILVGVNGNTMVEVTPGTTAVTIDDDMLLNQNIEFGQHFGPINTIVASRTGYDNIYYPETLPSNPKEYKLTDNLLLNNEDRAQYLPGIYGKLQGIEYDIYDCEITGYGGFEPLQKVIIQTGNNTYTSYVLNNEITLSDGVSESIYTELQAEVETEYKYATSDEKMDRKTSFIVDKVNNEVEAKVSGIEEDIDRLQDNQSSYVTTATYDADWKIKKDEILNTVSGEYVSVGEFDTYKTNTNTEISQKADSVTIAATASEVVTNAISGIQETINKVDETFTFDTNGLTIARGTSTMSLVLQNDRLSFKNGTDEVAYMSSNSFALTNLQTFKIGNFGFVIRDNGNVSFKKL